MGFDINFHVNPGDPVLQSEQYIKYSQYSFTDLIPLIGSVKIDLGNALASNESASVVNYLAWICRSVALIA